MEALFLELRCCQAGVLSGLNPIIPVAPNHGKAIFDDI